MGIEIITGYTGTRHITPAMDAAVWRSIYGADMYITNEGNCCEGSMPSINEFTILDGVIDMQGHMGYGTQESLSIDTCTTGFKRIDLICCRYTHNNITFVDRMEYLVLKGVEVQAPNEPIMPTYNTGIIAEGATIVDFPMYQINLDGSTVTFTQLAEVRNIGKEYSAGDYLRLLSNNKFKLDISASTFAIERTIASGSAVTIDVGSVKSGLNFVSYNIQFSSSRDGIRMSRLEVDSTIINAAQTTSAPGIITLHTAADCYYSNSTKPLQLYLYQNSGFNAPVNGNVKIITLNR